MHFTPKTYTVKEITNAIKNSLEEEFPRWKWREKSPTQN
jgi:hypothetical protein